MSDIGIFSSRIPFIIEQSCVDAVYNSLRWVKKFIKRIKYMLLKQQTWS